MSRVLADTNFWIALINPEDSLHNRAMNINDRIGFFDMVVPWPILYEPLGTHTIEKPSTVIFLKDWLNRKNIQKIPDADYRDEALKRVFHQAEDNVKRLSLVDFVISEILKANRYNINYFVSFDKKAIYYDWKNICNQKSITLIEN